MCGLQQYAAEVLACSGFQTLVLHTLCSWRLVAVSRHRVAGEAEPRPRGGQEVPGGHRGVCTDQGGQPAGPGCGGSASQVGDATLNIDHFKTWTVVGQHG